MFCFRNIAAPFCTLLVTSCGCVVNSNGLVLDAHTNQPMDSVIVQSYQGEVDSKHYLSQMVTDTTGKYHGGTDLTKGGFDGCPDLYLVLSKNGYQTDTIKNPNDATLYLIVSQ